MLRLIALTSLSVLVLSFSGCQQGPATPEVSVVDKTLSQVKDIKFLTDMTAVGFEWSPVNDERVEGYYIYRSNPNITDGKLQRVADIKDKYTTHYADYKLQPGTKYFYRFATCSAEKRESVLSETIEVTTTPLIEGVPFVTAITGLPHRVKLIWRPHPSQRVESYLIERNEFSKKEWTQIAKVDGRLNAEYIDAGLEENRVFRYRVRVRTFDGLVSAPSKIMEAGTKPLPKEIRNLKATTDIPKKIVLSWNPSDEKDFSHYRVYRKVNPLIPFYTYLAKTQATTYEDLVNENGKSYYYTVTSVDEDGLESVKQDTAITGSTLSAPTPVVITSSNQDGNTISITWRATDSRTQRYNVIKEFSFDGESKKEVITGINATSFSDSGVKAGIEYNYTVIAIDEYGLASDPSEKTIIEIPKER